MLIRTITSTKFVKLYKMDLCQYKSNGENLGLKNKCIQIRYILTY